MPVFITAEGIDGTGKSSVVSEVVKRLAGEGYDIELTKEPTDSWIGQAVRRGVKEGCSPYTEALLFTADRTVHVKEIMSWLEAGRNVISDRYFDSTVAYQAARLEEEQKGEGRAGLKATEWLRGLNKPFVLIPDRTLLFRASPATCMKRVDGSRTDRSSFEREAFLSRVQHYYDLIAKREKKRFVIIDAERPFQAVSDYVEMVLKDVLMKGLKVNKRV